MQSISGRFSLQFVGHRNHTGIDDRLLRRAAEQGVLTRIRRGVFVPTEVWQALSPDERRRLFMASALEMNPGLVASHRSAAALWGIPLLQHPPVVDILVPLTQGSRSAHGFSRHGTPRPEAYVVEDDGLRLTSPERTVVDLALTVPFPEAVVAADWLLAQGSRPATLFAVLDELAPRQNRLRAERVVTFADARSGSVGESRSRAIIEELGFSRPEIQVPFSDRRGLIGLVDFFWSDAALIGEFDGRVKYERPDMLSGRSPSDVVVEEKLREDRLRATGPRVVRWVWSDLQRPSRLAEALIAVGLRPERRPARA